MERVFLVADKRDGQQLKVAGVDRLADLLQIKVEEIPELRLYKWSVDPYVVVELNQE
jgi:hypothetical protein